MTMGMSSMRTVHVICRMGFHVLRGGGEGLGRAELGLLSQRGGGIRSHVRGFGHVTRTAWSALRNTYRFNRGVSDGIRGVWRHVGD